MVEHPGGRDDDVDVVVMAGRGGEVPPPSAYSQRVTASPKRMRSTTPCSAATRSKYAWISGPGEKRRLQSGQSAKEYE